MQLGNKQLWNTKPLYYRCCIGDVCVGTEIFLELIRGHFLYMAGDNDPRFFFCWMCRRFVKRCLHVSAYKDMKLSWWALDLRGSAHNVCRRYTRNSSITGAHKWVMLIRVIRVFISLFFFYWLIIRNRRGKYLSGCCVYTHQYTSRVFSPVFPTVSPSVRYWKKIKRTDKKRVDFIPFYFFFYICYGPV